MPHLWLRAETKPFERRVALTPETEKKLIASGYTVSVEVKWYPKTGQVVKL